MEYVKTMSHEFAFFVPNVSSYNGVHVQGRTITVQDPDFAHRLRHVLRLEEGQGCILFDREHHVYVTLTSYIGKKACEFKIAKSVKNTRLEPQIIALVPLLKRESFELACYHLVEFGASVIQPVLTQKIHRSWGGAKELERLHKIAVAAAEQSKHYAFPEINEPITLQQAAEYPAAVRLFCDPAGTSLYEWGRAFSENKPSSLALMIGPEGDLTDDEKALLLKQGFLLCALTPTILRAYQAISLVVGAFRSLL